MLFSTKKDRADGPASGSQSGLSTVAARTIRTYIKSVRVPDFLLYLLAKPMRFHFLFAELGNVAQKKRETHPGKLAGYHEGVAASIPT